MKPVGKLKRADGERGRERASEVSRERSHAGGRYQHSVTATAQRCECKRPWSNGDGGCVTCGKNL